MVVVIRNIVMVVVLHCKINGSTKPLDFLMALLSRIFLSRSLISICFASKVGYAKQEQSRSSGKSLKSQILEKTVLIIDQ